MSTAGLIYKQDIEEQGKTVRNREDGLVVTRSERNGIITGATKKCPVYQLVRIS
jgi:hypothetical protein